MRRAIGSLVKTLGLGAVFLVAVAAGVIAHLDVPAIRGAVVARVNAVLATAVAGRIVIDRVGSAGPGGVSDVDAHVLDPDGVTVLTVSGLNARVATATFVRSVVSGQDLVVDLDGLAVNAADVSLDGDERGLRLARAFGPRQQAASPPGAAGAGVRLSITHARITHASVHGRPGGAPSIDGEVGDADVSVGFGPEGLSLELHHAHLVARDMPPPTTTEGTVEGTLSIPGAAGSQPRFRAEWKGRVGDVAIDARGTFADGALDGIVDVPSTSPTQLRTIWPACPFREAASAHAEVHGQLPTLAVIARASVGKGAVAISGPLMVGDETLATLHVRATTVDVHAITGPVPSSDVGFTAEATFLRSSSGGLGGLVVLDTPGGTLGASRLPGVEVVAHASADPGSPPRAEASVTVREPGAPVHANLRLVPRGSSFQIAFDAAAAAPRLEVVRGLGPAIGGSVRADAKGTLDLGSGRLDAAADATLASMRAGPASLAGATLRVRVVGPVSDPAIDLELTGHDLAADPLHFDTLHARMHGPPTHAPVHVSLHGHGADFVARADLDAQSGVTLRDLSIAMDRGGESLRANASVVRIAAGQASVDGFVLQGLGAPLHASVRTAPGTLEIHAKSRVLDLVRLGRITGLPSVGGQLRLDVDAELHRTSAQGHVSVDLEQGSYASWKQASVHVEASLDGRKAAGSLKAALADVGTVEVSSATVELGGGSALEGSSWRGAWGGADVAAHVDLTRLAAQLPPGTLPASGAVDVKGRIARDSANDATPDVDVSAETHGLVLTGSAARWSMAGIAATLHLTVDGKTGHTALAGKLADSGGALLVLDVASDAVPYGRIFSTEPIPVSDLTSMPFQATATVPSRGLATLPAALGTRGMQGDLEARVDWSGAIVHPSVDLHATLSGGKPDVAFLSLPVDLTVAGHYDGAHVSVTTSATEHGRPVLDATAVLDARASDLFGDGPVPWTASARAKLSDFPLQSLAALDNRQVRGRANGTIQIDGLHRDARGSLSLELDKLQVGDVPCEPATISLAADGQALDFSARIAEEDGYAEARMHAGASWGTELLPSADRARSAQIFLAAKHFRTAVLLPFVAGIFTELDGRVDANANVIIDPAARTMKPQGTIVLSDGVVEVSALGNELHDVRATVTMTPDGLIRVDRASAKGLTGRLELAATARFQGFDLTGARALVQVPKKEPIPLVADGVQVGMFDGRLDVSVARDKTALAVNVEIPSMRLQLPLSASHDVQALGAMPGVRVGIAQGPAGFAPVALDGAPVETPIAAGASVPVRVAVHLGSDVEIKRGTDLDVHLEGGPTIDVAQTVTAKGQIRLANGSLNVQGKTFHIDKGTVTFVDDPTNPQVVLTASWAAPDGTTIFADFVGPLKTGKVSLRSEPMLKQDEILALLLYGTIDQTGSSGTGAPQLGVASGAAGNAASQKVNQALGGVNQALDNLGLNAGISTKLDTSEVTPRPEVEVQIARDISLQVAWVLGVPPPGSNPDQHLFTLNWRFLRQWSVQTTVGDAGTSILDLVWQHRY